MSAWNKSRNPAAVARAEEILRQMELSENRPRPISFRTTHICMRLSMHSSKNPEYALRADTLLRKLEGGVAGHGEQELSPNTFSFNCVIGAYCRSPAPNSVQLAAGVLRRLVKREGVGTGYFLLQSSYHCPFQKYCQRVRQNGRRPTLVHGRFIQGGCAPGMPNRMP